MMAPSSSPAEDAWFSAMKHGFKSRWGYQSRVSCVVFSFSKGGYRYEIEWV